MSLMLRKECQEVLDNNGFNEYHVAIAQIDRWDKNKVMSIVGPCGKELFKIKGVAFNRLTPTKMEIEYAVELLADFFRMHKKDVQAFQKAQEAFFKVKHLVFELEDTNVLKSQVQNDQVIWIRYVDKETDEKLFWYPGLSTSGWKYVMENTDRVQGIGSLARDKLIRDILVKKAKKIQEYCNHRKTFNDAKNKLTTCEI